MEVLIDDRPQQGPLVGLARGLAASEALWCFVVGCDMPFLRPAVILRMAEHVNGCDILAPRLGGRIQPLHAFYSMRCLPKANELLEEAITSPQALFARYNIREVSASDFLDLDPDLLSFRDLDTMEDYRQAFKLFQGLEQQEVAQ